MTTLAYGPPIVLDDLLPVAPPHSLLTIPRVVRPGPDGEHWMNGAAIYPYPPGAPLTWEPCSTGTDRQKDEGDPFDSPLFGPFVGYLPITCSAMGIGDPDDFRDRARVTMDAVESFAVERALSQGVVGSSNPFYTDVNFELLGNPSGVTPDVALSYLENAIGRTGRQGLIQTTPAVGAAWGWNKLEERGGTLYTVNGTPVALGGGYAYPEGAPSFADGQDYAFATGPVRVMRGEVNVLEIADVLDRQNNDVTYLAERIVVAGWDASLQAGVLVDWN